ncbi:hypothetical protein ATY79_22995 [Rhizobium sp. R693]|nr:hypothetical protein ATY79_22995 [Rhizobium sp. R693]
MTPSQRCLNDEQAFAIDLDLGTGPLLEQNMIAALEFKRFDACLMRASLDFPCLAVRSALAWPNHRPGD